jgi:hypothetical protein
MTMIGKSNGGRTGQCHKVASSPCFGYIGHNNLNREPKKMQLSAAMALAPIFKNTVEKLAEGYVEIAKGYGRAIGAIGEGIGRRIGGPS